MIVIQYFVFKLKYMKRIRLLFSVLALGLSLSSYSQSYPVGVRTVTYTDASRSNRAIAVEVHYPALTSGNNTTVAADSFPFVVFGHGFQMTASAYYPFADTLAQRGYIVAFPTTESSLLPSHPDFAQDIIYVYNGLIADNANSSSPFYHHVIAKGSIAGHSMGGGCAVLSAQYSNPAVCYWTLAEATTNPSSITAAPSMTKPYLSFSGSYDCIAPYGTNQKPTYDSSGSPCKVLVEIAGASHCQFGSGNFQCNFGEGVSGCASPPTSRTTQINTVLAYIEPYLDYYLKGICRSWTSFDSVYNADVVNTKTRTCTNIVPANATVNGASSFCTGTSTTLAALPSGFIYQWSSGQTTDSISISTGGPYTVTVGNGTCSIKSPSVTETILYPPLPPTAILGLDSICAGSDSVLYSVSSVAGATSYNWTVPSGWTIKSGASTSAIYISVNSTVGSISVNAQNNCGTSNSISKSLGLDSAPHLTGTISGADTVCLGSADQVYTFTGSTDGVLQWSVSAPYQIASGQSSASVHISGLDSAGLLTLRSSGSCGVSAPLFFAVAVIDSPSLSGAISGVDTICIGHPDQVYTFTGSNTGSLTWSVSAPYTINAGQWTSSLSISGVDTSGVVTLVSQKVCGTSAPLSIHLAVIDTPVSTVRQSGDSVVCTITGSAYQWYLNGQIVSGATSQFYIPTTNGSYSVMVTNSAGCQGVSAATTYVNVGINNVVNEHISVYPNPASDIVFIKADQEVKETKLIDGIGNKIKHQTEDAGGINISDVSSGIYFVEIVTKDGRSSYFKICKK